MTAANDQPGPAGTPVPPEARERAVDVLTRGYASDQLSEEQLETLLDHVYRATTLAELESLIANLPAPRPADDSASTDLARSTSSALQPEPVRIRALLSGQERKVTGTAPRRMQLRARLGYVELDLTQATFEPGVTEIDVRALMGYVQLRFPADVRVENEGGALLGFFALKGGEAPGTAERVVRVTGRAIMGFAECFVRSGHSERT